MSQSRMFVTLGLLSLTVVMGVAAKAAARAPLPDREEEREAYKLVRQAYPEEYRTARAPTAKAELARKLVDHAKRAGGDPDFRYVLLTEGLSFAKEGGALNAALEALDLLVEYYEVDGPQLRVESLNEISRRLGREEAVNRRYAEAALVLIPVLVEANLYEEGSTLAGHAATAAARADSPYLQAKIADWQPQLQVMDREYRRIIRDRRTLERDPDNVPARLAVGLFLGLVKGDWDAALPLLRDLPYPQVQPLARLESSRPTSRAGQVELAETWLAYSESGGLTVGIKDAAARRALYWYARAYPGLEAIENPQVRQTIEPLAKRFDVPLGLLTLDEAEQRRAITWRGTSYFFVDDPTPRATAERWATDRGGTLVSIADETEWDLVEELVTYERGRLGELWLGGTDDRSEGRWRWVDGTPWRFANWAQNQPDNYKGVQHFLAVWPDGTWHDTARDERLRFVVEWDGR